ncbi:MAG TPA: zinc ribbon domain-containing protein, partial [Nitrospirota bacterium]
ETGGKVRAIAARTKERGSSRPKISRYLLSGILTCGHCGAKMHGQQGVYRCATRCPDGRTLGQQKIEKIVLRWMLHDYFDEKAVASALAGAARNMGREKKDRAASKLKIEKNVKLIDNKISRLLALYEDGEIDRETINSKVKALEVQKRELTRVLANLSVEFIVTAPALPTIRNIVLALNYENSENLIFKKELLRLILKNATITTINKTQRKLEITYEYIKDRHLKEIITF